MGRQPVFRDPELGARFDAQGYVVVRLLDAGQVERLARDVPRLCPPDLPSNGLDPWSYVSHFDAERRTAVSEFVRAEMAGAIDRLFSSYHVSTGSLLQREPHAQALVPHQHLPSMADFTDIGIICWCPLIDCGEESGALQVVPGSHQLLWHVATCAIQPAWGGFADAIGDYLVTLKVRAGEAVLLAESLIHGSCPNRRDATRVALIAHLMPEGGVPAYFIDSEDQEGMIEICRSADEFSQSDVARGRIPPRNAREVLGTMPNGRVALNRRQFDALLTNGKRVGAGVDPYLAVAHLADAPVAAPAPGRLRQVVARLRALF